MNQSKFAFVFCSLLTSQFLMTSGGWAGEESMPSMPILKPTKSYTLKGDEDFEETRGFAEKEPMVRMQNLMMVEGSGYEGMDMDMSAAGSPKAVVVAHNHEGTTPLPASTGLNEKPSYDISVKSDPSKLKVGTNLIEFIVQKDGKPAKGLKLKAQVMMTSMDMGTDDAKVKEKSPGVYSLKATFSMKGPWAVKVQFSGGDEKTLDFDIQNK